MKRLAIAWMLLFIVGCGRGAAPTATSTATAVPTETPIPTPSPTPSPTPTLTPLPSPTATPTMAPVSLSAAPVDAVANAVGAIQSLDAEQAVGFFCAERETEMRVALETGFEELAALGLERDQMLQALTIDMGDLEYQELSRDGTQAVVHVAGTLRLDFEPEVLREVVRTLVEASGDQVTEQELDFLVSMASLVVARGVPLDTDIALVQEDGQWLVCDDLNFLQGLFELPLP